MKILILSTMQSFPWGGSEELWSRVALKALAERHSVQVCVKEWKEDHPKIVALQQKGAIITRRKSRRINLASRIMFRLIKRRKRESFFGEIEGFRPDCILISQGGTFDFFFQAELLAFIESLKKPYFIISQFNTENGNILPAAVAERIRQLQHPWTRFYFVSERNLRSAERQAAMPLQHAVVIDNPVNITVLQKVAWPASATLRMACVARYDCKHKGQDILIEALSHPEFRDAAYHLNFFGAGPDKLHLNNLVRFFNMQHRITVNDHATDIDMIWKEHHVLVLPSIAEGTPLVLQECMLKGRAALVTDVGDCSKLVREGETGFLAPVASVKHLKEKLAQLFATPQEKLKVMGDSAFSLANSLIDLNAPEKICKELEQSAY